jgi:pheromone shutdown protein TraB
MSVRFRILATGSVIVVSTLMGVTSAEDSRASIEAMKQLVVSWKPETKAVKIDQERLTVRRLDIPHR